MKKNKYIYLLMVAPSVIGFFIFFILPVAMSFAYSITDWSVYRRGINFIGFDNFIALLKDVASLAAIKNSVVYAMIITIVQNVFAILLAVALSIPMKTRNILKSVFFMPAVLSILIVGFLWSFIMSSTDYGLLNKILFTFGFDPINWLGDPNIALYSVLFTQVWQWTGWAMVIYLANIQSIDKTLYEAAYIDGATGRQKFFRITLPLLYPGVSFNVIMSMIGGLKVFDIVFAMTGGGPGYATETIMTTLIRRGFTEGRNGYASAYAIVFFVIVLGISRVMVRIFERWEEKIS